MNINMIKIPITKRFAIVKRLVNFKWKIYPTSDDEFYCELESFYEYADRKWHSKTFKTIKECDEWAVKKIMEANYVPVPNELGELFDEYKED